MYTEFGLELNNPDLNIYYIFCEKKFNTSEKGLLMDFKLKVEVQLL
jgi:hypothetical protein